MRLLCIWRTTRCSPVLSSLGTVRRIPFEPPVLVCSPLPFARQQPGRQAAGRKADSSRHEQTSTTEGERDWQARRKARECGALLQLLWTDHKENKKNKKALSSRMLGSGAEFHSNLQNIVDNVLNLRYFSMSRVYVCPIFASLAFSRPWLAPLVPLLFRPRATRVFFRYTAASKQAT
jgi:hypothetical protein